MAGNRVQAAKQLPDAYAKLAEINGILEGVLDQELYELVKLRASFLNGCAFCVDLHAHTAMKSGESVQRLLLVGAWREAGDHFTDSERAALALVDEVTRLGEHGVSDGVYAEVAKHFSEKETAALLMAIGLINLYNRLGVSTEMKPPKR
ncbi:carboxymuconolactone decarboxylase family protein [Thermobifida halotolerans]|uniref:Carboxymuconolactone decarboxylase family protein n=1 Tax=Thermobifida halotolerans TaxID=483545 RepID=A0A399FVF2_9ACTN|nr:carboxymuconolactone decarboxylase family protein [Thermobifida halotolerans]UOE18879.1 carboxymuconolactone decarboxylase family protein [Thermobifida halotolerans]